MKLVHNVCNTHRASIPVCLMTQIVQVSRSLLEKIAIITWSIFLGSFGDGVRGKIRALLSSGLELRISHAVLYRVPY